MSVDTTRATAGLDPTPPRGTGRRGRRHGGAAIGALGALAAISVAVAVGLDLHGQPGTVPWDGGVPVTDGLGGPGVPDVDAAAYIVADADGTVLAASGADRPLPVASLAKLMTAYVVYEAGDPDRLVTIPDLDMAAGESNIGLVAGEQQTRAVLLRAMLIVSAGDAARALAVDVGGSLEGFVAMMRDAAADLGLTGTSFTNPVGLDDPGQHSTAHDILVLSRQLMERDDFRATVSRRGARLHEQMHPATNLLLGRYAGADGVKTGHTDDAGWCLVASATRDGDRAYAVVLGASSSAARDASATALLDWAFAR